MKAFSSIVFFSLVLFGVFFTFQENSPNRFPANSIEVNTPADNKPVEIVKNDGKELVLMVNKDILNVEPNERDDDFLLYYHVGFNDDMDKLPREERKAKKIQIRDKFLNDKTDCESADDCEASVGDYLINLDGGEEWRKITLPIEKRGKYTIHFYRQGLKARAQYSAYVKRKESGRLGKFWNSLKGSLGGLLSDSDKDMAYYPLWKQEVFVEPEHQTPQELIETLAQKYSPVSFMHSTEEYLPTSLEYMANEVDKDPELDEEMFQLTLDSTLKGKGLEFKRSRKIEFPYKDLKKVLPYNSDVLMVLSSTIGKSKTRLRYRRGTPEDATVYYSFMESPDYEYAFLNYHFLFPFDPKTGTSEEPALPAHTFDRESVTIVLDLKTLEPNFIVYGAHLPNQLMGLLSTALQDPQKLQVWLGGRVKQYWNDALKVGGTHPIISMAQGSHGVYPTKGNYVVSMKVGKTFDTLIEGADGTQILYPNVLNFGGKKLDGYDRQTSFKVKSLDLGKVTSTSWNNLLAFSGDTVDVLGPMNAKFPPYTGREFDIETYVLGDSCAVVEVPDFEIPKEFQKHLLGCYIDLKTREQRREIYNWDLKKLNLDVEQALRDEVSRLDSLLVN